MVTLAELRKVRQKTFIFDISDVDKEIADTFGKFCVFRNGLGDDAKRIVFVRECQVNELPPILRESFDKRFAELVEQRDAATLDTNFFAALDGGQAGKILEVLGFLDEGEEEHYARHFFERRSGGK